MQVTSKATEGFRPFSIEIAFETKKEAEDFYNGFGKTTGDVCYQIYNKIKPIFRKNGALK